MVKLLKYLKGYVRIKVSGFAPERFMNLCSNKNILLWDIIKEENVYYMSISLSAFYQLRPIVRKTGTKVAIIKRYGLPFFVPILFARKIFVIGLLLCIAFWIGSSYFIWNIELNGNYQITEDVFSTFLKENNIKVGMQKKQINIEVLEKSIRQTFPEITWTSAKLDGTNLLIDIKENEVPFFPAINEDVVPKDIIAEYEGTVESIIVRKGVPKVAIGDTVAEGDIMIEGKIPIFNEDATIREYQYVTSDADIFLNHTITFQDTLDYDYIKKEYTGRNKKRYFIRFGEKELKWVEEKPFLVYDCIIKEQKSSLFEMFSIPIIWGSYSFREYQNVEYEYTLSEAKDILEDKINDFIISLDEKGVQIIEKNVNIDTSSGMWIINGQFIVIERAGALQDSNIENLSNTGVDVLNE